LHRAEAMSSLRLCGAVLLAAVVACSTNAKKEVTKTALDVQSSSQRRDTFEAMARALDERPEEIDLFYSVARQHPKLMDRFIDNTTKDLASEEMARLVARHLAERPDALEMTMKLTMVEVAKQHEARRAMDRAIAAESRTVSDILTDDSRTMTSVVASLLDVIETKPRARSALIAATERNRAKILGFVKDNPKLAKEIAEQVIREEVKDAPAAEKILRAVKIIDDDHHDNAEKAKKAP
jgi:hypothetical protein